MTDDGGSRRGCFGEISKLACCRGAGGERLWGGGLCVPGPPVVGLGGGWSCGVLAEAPSCPSASFQALPGSTPKLRAKAWWRPQCPGSLLLWGGTCVCPWSMVSEAALPSPSSCPPPAGAETLLLHLEQPVVWGAGQSGVRAPSVLLRDMESRGCCGRKTVCPPAQTLPRGTWRCGRGCWGRADRKSVV